MDARAAVPLRAGDQRPGMRERDCPSRRDDRYHRSAGADRSAAPVVDPGYAPGAVVAVPGAGAAWKLLPGSCPPRQTIASRLSRWVRLGVLDRALAVLNACL